MHIPDRNAWARLLGTMTVPLAYVCALNFNGISSKMVMLLVVTAITLCWAGLLLWQDIKRAKLVFPGGWVPVTMLAFFSWLLMCGIWSIYPYTSFLYVWIIGAMPLWCLLWLKTPKDRVRWKDIWGLLLTVHAGFLIWGIVEYLGLGRRANGPLLDANAYGALVNALFFPILFRLLYLQQQKAPAWVLWVYRLLLAASLFALFASDSRGALLAWLVMMIPTLALIINAQRNRRLIAGVLALGVAVVVVSGVITWHHRNVAAERPHMLDLKQRSYQHRLYLSRSAWEIYKDHPWLGTGLQTFKLYYPAYRDPRENSSAGFYAHNDYIQFLQEGGPILLFLLLLCWLAAVQPAWAADLKNIASDKPSPSLSSESLEKIGLAFGVSALFIQAGVNFIFYVLPHSMLAGLFIAQLHKDQLTAQWTMPIPAGRVIPAMIMIMLLAFPLWKVSLSTASAMVLTRQSDLPWVRYIRDDFQRGHLFAQLMTILEPGHNRPHTTLADFYHGLATPNDESGLDKRLMFALHAREHYAQALRNMPISGNVNRDLARLLIHFPQLQENMPEGISNDPELLLKRSIQYAPGSMASYVLLARLYETRNEPDKAYDVLVSAQKWLEVPVSSARERVILLERTLFLAQQLGRKQDLVPLAIKLQRWQRSNKAAARILGPDSSAYPLPVTEKAKVPDEPVQPLLRPFGDDN